MKAILIAMLMLFSASVNALAQRDPDDPGIQDSVIIGSVQVDSGATEFFVPVYLVADDTVDYFFVPLIYNSIGGIYPDSVIYPDTTLCVDQLGIQINRDYILLMGWFGLNNPPCPRPFPHDGRFHLLSIRFRIEPYAPAQFAIIDTFPDLRNGPVVFGMMDGITELSPAFGRGYIYYGPQTGTGDGDMTVPGGFSLSQNYPNPFNAQTTISYSLPEPGHVTLSIYNLLGQKVATLVDEVKQAGEHKVVWEAGDTPSGVYFVKIAGSGDDRLLKMIMLK